jgi:hypothetical protein
MIEAYGFTSKLMLAQHFDMAASTLSGRYRRGGFPADMASRCVADTGVSLEWLATGEGKKFADDQLDIMKFPGKKLVDGKLYDSGYVMFDKVFFRAGTRSLQTLSVYRMKRLTTYSIRNSQKYLMENGWLILKEN